MLPPLTAARIVVCTAMLPRHDRSPGSWRCLVLEIVSRRRVARFCCRSSPGRCCGGGAALAFDGYGRIALSGQLSVAPQELPAKAIVLALAVPVLLLWNDDFTDRAFTCWCSPRSTAFALLCLPTAPHPVPRARADVAAPLRLSCPASGSRTAPRRHSSTWCWAAPRSATLLMGAAYLYGGTGSLALSASRALLRQAKRWPTTVRATRRRRLLSGGSCCTVSHAAPDAYEGASVPVTAYMATIVKAGVLLAVVRLSALRRSSRRWRFWWQSCR